MGNISYAAEVMEVIPSSETILTEKEISVEDTDENIAAEDGIVSDIARLDEMLPAEKEDLAKSKQRMVEEVVSLAEMDALSAAESLKRISDEDTYEAALHEVLDNYYAEDSSVEEEQIAVFSEAVDARAAETLANYAEAKAERDDQENLNYETGKVMAVFEAGTSDEEIAEIAGRIGDEYYIISNFDIDETLPEDKLKRLKACGTREFPKVVSICIDLDKTVSRAGTILEALSCVEDASENHTDIESASIQTDLGVNDAYVNKQEEYLRQINVPEAWASWSRSGSDSNCKQSWVAVIDTGLDINHPDLKNMYLPERSVTIGHAGTGVVEKMDGTNCYWGAAQDAYHGTHVAGIIAAQSNNGIGVVGVASVVDKTHVYSFIDCRIIAINASHLDLNEKKETVCRFSDENLAAAIYHAVNNGADVINMSLGGPSTLPSVQVAIDYAHTKNVIICAAAGNAEQNEKTGLYEDLDVMRYPASYSHVVSVANVDSANNRHISSVYNASVDLAAPGTDIYNCIFNFQYGISKTIGYEKDTGTSMATPMVSAGMAMIRAIMPDATADAVETVLNSTATDLYTSGRDVYTGFGLINLGLAVQTAKKQRLNAASPQSFAATPVNYQSVKLSWKAVDWAEQYIIYRSTAINGTYTKIKHLRSTEGEYLANNKWKFTDKSCDTGTTYYYKVRAVSVYKDRFAYSGFSPVVSAKCTLAAPGGFALTSSKGKITASWNKVEGATGYRILRATSKTGTYTRIKSIASGNTLSYADTSVTAGKTYYYKVRAYRTVNGKDVLSDFSAIVGKKAQ